MDHYMDPPPYNQHTQDSLLDYQGSFNHYKPTQKTAFEHGLMAGPPSEHPLRGRLQLQL
jgi:hypothetical protein